MNNGKTESTITALVQAVCRLLAVHRSALHGVKVCQCGACCQARQAVAEAVGCAEAEVMGRIDNDGRFQ